MSFKRDVIEKLDKIEVKLEAQTIQLALNNAELKEHTRRSTNLEERVSPLEHSHVFFNKMAKVILAVAGLSASIITAYHYLVLK